MGMKHCSNCMHCGENIISRYVLDTDRFFCRLNYSKIDFPFWGGIHCEHYKKDEGFFLERANYERIHFTR